ncbi:MAG: helix-turn-helix domain-containing protein [Bacteroidota bacterium]|nr:helix-turn-helix domain-containing protein [Bacteroidota bacterium]
MINSQNTTEQKILDAARKVFHQKGYDGARMQEIAEEAGINKSLLHYYFRSKDNLFDAVFTEAMNGLLSRITGIITSEKSLEDKIRYIFNDYISFLQKNSYVPWFIINAVNHCPEKVTSVLHENNIDPDKIFKYLRDSASAEEYGKPDFRQLYVNIIALCAFPVVAKPILKDLLGLTEEGYQQFLEERKTILPDFFMNAIRKK